MEITTVVIDEQSVIMLKMIEMRMMILTLKVMKTVGHNADMVLLMLLSLTMLIKTVMTMKKAMTLLLMMEITRMVML